MRRLLLIPALTLAVSLSVLLNLLAPVGAVGTGERFTQSPSANTTPTGTHPVAIPDALSSTSPTRPPHVDRVAVGSSDEPQLTLRCESADSSAIRCGWSTVDPARAYRLWRVADPGSGRSRRVMATIAADARPGYVDTDVVAGHRYAYAVEAVAVDGTSLGFSKPVLVGLVERHRELRLTCDSTATDVGRGVVCQWSVVDANAATGWLLWRSVDGGERAVIARIGVDGRPRHLDQDVSSGHRYRYLVQLIDAEGAVLASSPVENVGLPVADEPTDAEHRPVIDVAVDDAPVSDEAAVIGDPAPPSRSTPDDSSAERRQPPVDEAIDDQPQPVDERHRQRPVGDALDQPQPVEVDGRASAPDMRREPVAPGTR